MNGNALSLRSLVNKWVASTAYSAHVTHGRLSATRRRYVCVEYGSAKGRLAILFFRHDDGSWNVFPPTGDLFATRCAQPHALAA